jgi:DNA-binding MarR family transcriptional regulator
LFQSNLTLGRTLRGATFQLERLSAQQRHRSQTHTKSRQYLHEFIVLSILDGLARRKAWSRLPLQYSPESEAPMNDVLRRPLKQHRPNLLRPASIEDMLDYQLYLIYRDCGYVTERMCKLEFGVNRRRWRIIATLSSAEGITVSELAERADLDIAQTSRTIGTLSREGYTKRLSNPGNARLAQVILTAKGRNLYNSMFSSYCRINKDLLRGLDEKQVEQLTSIIGALRVAAEQTMKTKSNAVRVADVSK